METTFIVLNYLDKGGTWLLVQPYFQLKIKIAESSATRNLFSHSFSVMSLYSIVIHYSNNGLGDSMCGCPFDI